MTKADVLKIFKEIERLSTVVTKDDMGDDVTARRDYSMVIWLINGTSLSMTRIESLDPTQGFVALRQPNRDFEGVWHVVSYVPLEAIVHIEVTWYDSDATP